MQTSKKSEKTPDVEPSKGFNERLYGLILEVPVFGAIIQIINAYAYDGDWQSSRRLAPISSWIQKFWGAAVVAVVLTLFSTPYLWVSQLTNYLPNYLLTKDRPTPGSLIISIFPNVLGFGIGVYALIFGLSSILIKVLQDRLDGNKSGDKKGSVLMLNADMAYPLLVLTLTLIVGVLQGIIPSSHMLEVIAWFSIWYSFLIVIELLSVLFNLGENELLNKLNAKK